MVVACNNIVELTRGGFVGDGRLDVGDNFVLITSLATDVAEEDVVVFQFGVEPNVGVDHGQSMFGTSNFSTYLVYIMLTSAPPKMICHVNYVQVHQHRS